jgi:hypothetical protein
VDFPDFQPMSPDEMQRAMQFIVNQQAQFTADMEKLSVKTDRIADGLIGLTGLVNRAVENLAAEHERTEKEMREGDARLTAHIDRVESHLNAVIDLIERRHDGRPPA